jgi:hypothetical protein
MGGETLRNSLGNSPRLPIARGVEELHVSADSGLQRNKRRYSSDTRYRTARRIADLLIIAIRRRLASSAGGAVKDPLFL